MPALFPFVKLDSFASGTSGFRSSRSGMPSAPRCGQLWNRSYLRFSSKKKLKGMIRARSFVSNGFFLLSALVSVVVKRRQNKSESRRMTAFVCTTPSMPARTLARVFAST